MAVTDQGGAKKRKPGSKIDDINNSVSQAFKGFKAAMPLEDTSSSRFYANKALAPKKSLGSIVNVGKKSRGASDSWGDPVEPSRAPATQPTPVKGDITPHKVTPKQEKELKKDANKLLHTLAGKEPGKKTDEPSKDASKDPSSGLSKDFVSGAVALLPMILGGLFGGEDGLAAGAEGTKSYIDTKAKLDEAANEVDLANKKLAQDNEEQLATAQYRKDSLDVEKSKLPTAEEKALGARKTNAEIGLLGAQTGKARAEANKASSDSTSKGKMVTAKEATAIGDLNSAAKDIDKIFAEYNGLGVGSSVAQFVPGSKSSNFLTTRKIYAQNIGRVLEGGKLTDADYERKYVDFMPDADDFESTAQNKRRVLQSLVQSSKEGKLKSLGEAGYDISGFKKELDNLEDEKRSKLEALRAQFKR